MSCTLIALKLFSASSSENACCKSWRVRLTRGSPAFTCVAMSAPHDALAPAHVEVCPSGLALQRQRKCQVGVEWPESPTLSAFCCLNNSRAYVCIDTGAHNRYYYTRQMLFRQ